MGFGIARKVQASTISQSPLPDMIMQLAVADLFPPGKVSCGQYENRKNIGQQIKTDISVALSFP